MDGEKNTKKSFNWLRLDVSLILTLASYDLNQGRKGIGVTLTQML